MTADAGDIMIRFSCEKCGQKFKVPKSRAGKKGTCPKCKNVIIVPAIGVANQLPAQDPPPEQAQVPEKSPYDPVLLAVPQKPETAAEPQGQYAETDSVMPDAQTPLLGYRKSEPESPPERKLPWLIDIFLYPTSLLSLVILVLCLTVPPIVRIMLLATGTFILIFFWFGWIIVILLYVYTFWYFSTSVRQSAEGQLRAPNAVTDAPGLWEVFWQTLRAIICLLFFFLPMMIYLGRTRTFDTIFWLLLGVGVFLFPMGLLAVTVLDSFSGLNPIFVIGSILSTLPAYCPLVVIYFALGWLLTKIGPLWKEQRVLAYASIAGFVYLLLVAGHLLGRFYFRYEEKLNWDL